MKNSLSRCWATVAFVSATVPAAAQIGIQRMSIGEYMLTDMATKAVEVVRLAQQAAMAKRNFEHALGQARTRFRANLPNRSNLALRERELADALWEKDIYFLIRHLAEGTSGYGKRRVQASESLTGGAVDGGIPTEAQTSFLKWVRAVRAELGATSESEVLSPGEADLVRALSRTIDDYRIYKADRDRAELARIMKISMPAGIESHPIHPPHYPIPLKQAQVGGLGGIDFPSMDGPLYKRMQSGINRHMYEVLRCTYGPTDWELLQGDERFSFWTGSVPPELRELRGLPLFDKSELPKMGIAAIEKCPPSLQGAAKIRDANVRAALALTAVPVTTPPTQAPLKFRMDAPADPDAPEVWDSVEELEAALDQKPTKNITGSYRVVGTRPDGSVYRGTCRITKTGQNRYHIVWQAGSTYEGDAVREKDRLTISSGPNAKMRYGIGEGTLYGTAPGITESLVLTAQ